MCVYYTGINALCSMQKMINTINEAWGWLGITAEEVMAENEFGNLIFQTSQGEFWRIIPEEPSCSKIASNESDYKKLWNDTDFVDDWEMTLIIRKAVAKLGPLQPNEKYCLKIPAVIGGRYESENFGKISYEELISFSGDVAFQINDLPDGIKVKIQITH